jgi:hypothetical protein
MKGYRTVIFYAVVMLGGMVGWHVAPDVINNYLDLIFAGIGIGILTLRFITNTPFGAKVAADLGTTPAAIQSALATIDPNLPDNLNSATSDLNEAIGKLTGHVPIALATIDSLSAVAQTLSSAASQVATASTADTAAVRTPVSSVAPAAIAPAVAAVSAAVDQALGAVAQAPVQPATAPAIIPKLSEV